MRFFAGMATCVMVLAGGGMAVFARAGGQAQRGQDTTARYARLAPVEEYLMDRGAEIALARSAAPAEIGKEATVLVLGRHGYETAAQGSNGFVCMVERGWVGTLDWGERLNPKVRGADCLNAQAARSIVPMAEMRTEMVLAGRSVPEIAEALEAALRRGEVPALEAGAMSYMMGKGSYLTDEGDHNMPHLMFFIPLGEAAAWGSGVAGSPVGSAPYWFFSERTAARYPGLPPMRIFTVSVARWSDGTAAQLP